MNLSYLPDESPSSIDLGRVSGSVALQVAKIRNFTMTLAAATQLTLNETAGAAIGQTVSLSVTSAGFALTFAGNVRWIAGTPTLTAGGTDIIDLITFDGGAHWGASVRGAGAASAAQVQTDWNATSGLGVLLNKPVIPVLTPTTTKTLRNVATRCRNAGFTTASFTTCFNRSMHINRSDAYTGFRPRFPNWYVTSTGEFSGLANFSISASLEYPAGTYTPLLFGGATSVVVPAGTNAIADACAVVVPPGEHFWIRSVQSCPNGIYTASVACNDTAALGAGDQTKAQNTAFATDYTVNAYVGASTTNGYFPIDILGMSSVPSVIIYGDSRAAGLNDTPTINNGLSDAGEIARYLGVKLPYTNCGVPSDKASTFVTSHALRMALITSHTHVHVQYGINDVYGGATAAAIEASLTTIYGYCLGYKISQSTILPQSTSTDAWLTQANQTPIAADSVRQALNTWIRARPVQLWAVFECADVVEYLRSGKWKTPDVVATAVVAITGDGTHPSPYGYQWLQASNAIEPRVFN